MDKLVQKVQNYMRKESMPLPGRKILAGVSGGADSVCLLLVLRQLGYDVTAVHIEHGIRGAESMEDACFTEVLCRSLGVPVRIRKVDAPARAAVRSLSLEEAAREARYDAFAEIAEETGISVIAVAHHLEDTAETFLWNLVRGSGISGLCGIAPVRRSGRMTIIRPLLSARRDEIEAFLRERGQIWREDSTNADTSYTRNAIRRIILPQLNQLNAGAAEHIAAAAGDLRETESFLEEEELKAAGEAEAEGKTETEGKTEAEGKTETEEKAEAEGVTGAEKRTGSVCGRAAIGGGKPALSEIRIQLDAFRKMHPLLQKRLLLRAIGKAAGGSRDVTRKHAQAVWELSRADCGKSVSLPSGLRAVREETCILLTKKDPVRIAEEIRIDTDGEYCFGGQTFCCRFGVWQGAAPSQNRFTKYLAYDTMTPYVILRARRPGDYLIVNAAGGRRKLKDYLIDEKVPREDRDAIALITQGSRVLWAVGYRISEDAKVTEGCRYIEISRRDT